MAREFFGFEKGLDFFAENGDAVQVRFLFGAAAPGGDAGDQDASPIGSVYARTSGEFYQKIANGGSAADWEKFGNVDIDTLSWRSEKVRFATDDTLSAGTVDITTITDNEGMVIGDINVGEFVIGDRDGVPALFEVTAKPGGDDITLAAASQPIASNDTFMVQQYLPDSPAAQEGQAIVHVPTAGSPAIKIADVNWNFADGISLAAGYTPASGDISSADTVQSAVEKLDGNVDALTSAVGVAQGDNDMGTYTGSLLNDNESAKQNIQQLETESEALRSSLGGSVGDTDMGTYTGSTISDNVDQRTVNQELETAIEAISPTSVGPADLAQATPTTVDTVLVDECQSVEWEVTAHDIGDPTKVQILTITAFHDGHAGADAANVKDMVYAKAKLGGNFNLSADAVLSGTGAAQTIGLQLETSDSDGIRYTVQRRNCVPAL